MINIKYGLLLPWTFRLLAACAIILGLSAWQTNSWITFVIRVGGFLLWWLKPLSQAVQVEVTDNIRL